MTLFARLKHWSDDAPEDLAEVAANDSSVKDLCTQLSIVARVFRGRGLWPCRGFVTLSGWVVMNLQRMIQ